MLTGLGHEVQVANPRKLRAIYTSDRKSDKNDARMLARFARMDPKLLHPVEHGSEEAQRDLLQVIRKNASLNHPRERQPQIRHFK